MAKAEAVKPKSSFGDFFKKLGGGTPKAKPAARPPSSTMTNLKPVSATGTQPAMKAAAAADKLSKPRWSVSGFELPMIGGRSVIAQLQLLGAVALLLMIAVAVLVYLEVTSRTQNSTYITIASQMQFHTQRLAKAAGIAARGQQSAFPQVQDSRDEFAAFLGILQKGGFAFGQNVESAASNEELKSRLEELNQRWPESAQAATAILAAQADLVALGRNVAQIRVGSEEMAALAQE